MKKLLIIAAALLFAMQSFAAFTGLPADVENALPAIDKYHGDYPLILWANEKFELTTDGKQIYEYHFFRYLPDEAARDHWGDYFADYIYGKEDFEVITSRCYTKDGRAIDSTPENAFNDNTPEALQHAPEMSSFHEMVITHLGLENESIVELYFRRTNNDPQLPWLEGKSIMEEPSPTVFRSLDVQIPSGMTLQYAVGPGVSKPEVNGGTYTWTVRDLPGYHMDDFAFQYSQVPYVVFSTADSWQTVRMEIAKRVEAASAMNLVLPESLKKELHKRTSLLNTAPAIKHWVHDHFARYEFSHPEFMTFLRPLDKVFASGYGNHLELAALVSKLFQQEGLKNSLVLQFPGDVRVPALVQLENVIIDPLLPGQMVLFDAMTLCEAFTRMEITGKALLSLYDSNAPEPIVAEAKPNESFSVTLFIDDLEADTVTGHGTLVAMGRIAPQEYTRREGPVATVESLLDFEGLTCTSATCRLLAMDQVMIAFDFTMDALEAVDDYRVLLLSALKFNMLSPEAPFKMPERRFAQELTMPAKLSLTVKGMLPDKWSIAQQPEARTASMGSLTNEVKMSDADGYFEFSRTLDCKADKVIASEWPSYRAYVLESLPQPANTLVFNIAE